MQPEQKIKMNTSIKYPIIFLRFLSYLVICKLVQNTSEGSGAYLIFKAFP